MKKTFRVFALVLALVLCLSCASAETLLIGIPDDGTNLSRGIKLLETAGLITVDPAKGFNPELSDVTGYIYDIEIMPAQANTLPSTLADYAASTINSTYSVPYGLIPSRDGLIIEEQGEGDNPYVNIIVARTADKDNELYKKIVSYYQTQKVAEFIVAKYQGARLPVFAYDAAQVMDEKEVLSFVEYSSPKAGKTVVRMGVVGANNDEWKVVQYLLDQAGENIYIDMIEFDAYNLPNEALNSGNVDLNNFQHKAFLNKDCAANNYDLTVIGDTLIAPLTLYSAKYQTLDALKEAAGLVK